MHLTIWIQMVTRTPSSVPLLLLRDVGRLMIVRPALLFAGCLRPQQPSSPASASASTQPTQTQDHVINLLRRRRSPRFCLSGSSAMRCPTPIYQRIHREGQKVSASSATGRHFETRSGYNVDVLDLDVLGCAVIRNLITPSHGACVSKMALKAVCEKWETSAWGRGQCSKFCLPGSSVLWTAAKNDGPGREEADKAAALELLPPRFAPDAAVLLVSPATSFPSPSSTPQRRDEGAALPAPLDLLPITTSSTGNSRERCPAEEGWRRHGIVDLKELPPHAILTTSSSTGNSRDHCSSHRGGSCLPALSASPSPHGPFVTPLCSPRRSGEVNLDVALSIHGLSYDEEARKEALGVRRQSRREIGATQAAATTVQTDLRFVRVYEQPGTLGVVLTTVSLVVEMAVETLREGERRLLELHSNTLAFVLSWKETSIRRLKIVETVVGGGRELYSNVLAFVLSWKEKGIERVDTAVHADTGRSCGQNVGGNVAGVASQLLEGEGLSVQARVDNLKVKTMRKGTEGKRRQSAGPEAVETTVRLRAIGLVVENIVGAALQPLGFVFFARAYNDWKWSSKWRRGS
ncbi:hypothetical protein GALMADRAFT_144488 [Galerina marginata CBS 339.88]|uniref:Uncharacterized protein n=1 Tax=Galerina marginata (strain CBS 339.88) TaxID=685588 RepID=A0A067SSC9_GALM3|nr:hypothetical protein GALMADRAFT_144488 [Galerina marginata CBS 339.88]